MADGKVGTVWDEQAFSVSREPEVEARELGAETDEKLVARNKWGETPTNPEHSNVDPEEEVARNRNTLLSYFNDIATIPTLTKEQEVMLAKEMEAATFEMRSGILSVPFTWREAVSIWRGLQAENRVTAKMSEAYGSGTPSGEERGEYLDRALKRVETLLAKHEQGVETRAAREKIDRVEQGIRRALRDADLSMQIFERIRRKLRSFRDRTMRLDGRIQDLRHPRRAPRTEKGRASRDREIRFTRKQLRELEAEVGIKSADFAQLMEKVDLAYDRLMYH